jgi:hypothetical protein
MKRCARQRWRHYAARASTRSPRPNLHRSNSVEQSAHTLVLRFCEQTFDHPAQHIVLMLYRGAIEDADAELEIGLLRGQCVERRIGQGAKN